MYRTTTGIEPLIRGGVFAGTLLVMAAWEVLAPRRPQPPARWRRWPGNLGLVLLNTLALRALLPFGLVGIAVLARAHGWGLFNVLALPVPVVFPASLVMLDGAIFAQHVAFHRMPLLWRLHRLHHADVALDVTSGLRFHPLETFLSAAFKMAVVIAVGAPAMAVLVFEAVLNAAAMFNHANAAVPRPVERLLRWLIVTPDMHRVHHSTIADEMNSNFGFNLPWWDRLFGTYRAGPAAGHDGMTIGLPGFRDATEVRLGSMLTQPWR